MKRRSCSNLVLIFVPTLLALVLHIISYFASFFLTAMFGGNIDSSTVSDSGVLLFIRSILYLICFILWFQHLKAREAFPDSFDADSKQESNPKISTAIPDKKISIPVLLSAICAGSVLEYLSTLSLEFLEVWFPDLFSAYESDISSLIPDGSSVFSTLLILLSVAILSPIAEEYLFRGVTYHYAKCFSGNTILAVIISSLMFGLYHLDPVQAIYAFIAGIFLGLYRSKTDSLLYGILFHIAFNITSYLILFLK